MPSFNAYQDGPHQKLFSQANIFSVNNDMRPGFVTIELQVSLYIYIYIYRITTHYIEVLRVSIIQLNIIACLAISS